MNCDVCGAECLDIDVKCGACGAPLTSTGAFRMVGTTALSHYEIIDVLGQGGMSVVYKGRHSMTAQEVALKILPPELAAHSQVKSRFLEEARALAQLDHPNIVHLYNFGEEKGCFVLAMQYVHGRTWERMILEAERLDWITSLRITLDVLRALEYAHGRGIVHRDMKPSNVLVRDDDGTATVMDFGIAKMTTSTRLTATGQTMGTVRYMSPEQVRGQEVDPRTDLYSLGATLYESIVGDTPFDGDTHFEIMTKHLSEPPRGPSVLGIEVPAALEAALLRSLAKKPEERFASAREFRKELEAILKHADVGTAETLRMSRDMVAQARVATTGPAEGLAELLEPGTASSPTVTAKAADRVAAEPAELAEFGGRSRKPLLWLGLGAAVVAAGGVALAMTRGGGAGAGAAPAPAPAAVRLDAGLAPNVLGEGYDPPDVEFAVTREFEGVKLRVRAVPAWDPALVHEAYVSASEQFISFLKARGLRAELAAPPLTVLVVPSRVFCDPRNAERGAPPADCGSQEVNYRPGERTLFVIDKAERLRANVGYGVAVATCIAANVPECDDAVAAFDEAFSSAQPADPEARPPAP